LLLQIKTKTMKKYLIILIAVLLTTMLQAQGLVINGAKINISPGAVLYVEGSEGNLLNLASGEVALRGSMKVDGNWLNNSNFIPEEGSVVTFNGTTPQQIGGSFPTTFSNLTLNNNTGVTLANNITVTGILDFQNGMLNTQSNTVTSGAAGTIVNASSSKYVNGRLARTYASTGSKAYPIGKGGNYRPLTFQYTGLTGTSVVTAEQFESGLTGTLPALTELLTTDRYWTITQSGGSNAEFFVTLDPTGYTPSRPVVILRQNAGEIASFASASPNYTNLYAVNSFGDFAIGQKSCSPVPFTPPTVANLQATGPSGSVIKWYSTAAGGTALEPTEVLVNGNHYYASQTTEGLESLDRAEITALVDPTPCAPAGATAQSFGGGATVSDLAATGQNILWYPAATGVDALPPSTPLTTGTHYWATQTKNCIESATKLEVVVTVN
jgi:hypothetical protein